MLIKCNECGGNVSDKAISCPHCGNPINMPTNNQTRPIAPSRKRKWHKLPNGYGSIRKLSGNRRNPYAAYPPTTEYKDNGTAVLPPVLGYFETYNKALECLTEYNKSPYDISTKNKTFAEVYQLYYDDKFVKNQKRVYSVSAQRSSKAAFNNLSKIHNTPISELRVETMQDCIDSCKLKHASLEHMVILLKQVSKFALQRDYIQKDYSQFLKINVVDDDEKGVPFTEDELKTLWKNSDKANVQLILFLIYSGVRIGELDTLTYDMDNHIMIGGNKTKAGKNRTIPIHDAIYPFVDTVKQIKLSDIRRSIIEPALVSLGLSKSSKGTKHTPHDCRHTFSWLADKYKMDDMSKHLIMGHSLGNDIEVNTYGHRTVEELKQEMAKIKTDNVR